MIQFGPWSLILSFGALTGVAVAAVLVRTAPNRTANRLLAALLLMVVLRLVPYIIGYAGFYDAYPWLSFAPFDLPLSFGPLLWLYVVRLVRGALPVRWYAHLVPAALHLVIYGTIFVLCTVPQKTAIALAVIDPFLAPAITAASLLMLGGYGWRALTELRAYQQRLDGHLSNREEFRLVWLRTLLLLFAGTGVVWLGFAVADLVVQDLSYVQEFPLYVAQAGLVWVLGLLAMRHAATVYPLPTDEPADPLEAPQVEPRHDPDYRALGERYLAAIRANDWARDPQLTLARLAEHLDTSTATLSRALNQGLGQSFNECINRLRVEYVAGELAAGSTLALVQIGFDAGFNSKASFQRAFVLYANMTPSAFREAQRVKSGS